jgi:DNA ligase (NAD+)
VASKLVEHGLVRDLFDLFQLDLERLARLELGVQGKLSKRGNLMKAPEIGANNAQRILDAIARARQHDLARWILAMQIHDVGGSTAQDLAAVHGDLPTLVSSTVLPLIVRLADADRERVYLSPQSRKNPPKDEADRVARTARVATLASEIAELERRLALIPGAVKIGAETARHTSEFFSSKSGMDFVAKLAALGIAPTWARVATGGVFLGKSFVLTGTLPTLSREDATKMIENAGGKVIGSVSKKTNYVLAGENAGSKLEKAKECGVSIIDEAEFLRMLQE